MKDSDWFCLCHMLHFEPLQLPGKWPDLDHLPSAWPGNLLAQGPCAGFLGGKISTTVHYHLPLTAQSNKNSPPINSIPTIF